MQLHFNQDRDTVSQHLPSFALKKHDQYFFLKTIPYDCPVNKGLSQ